MRRWPSVLLLATGCLFRDPVEPRYFRPESAAIDGTTDDRPASAAGVPVRLRPVQSTAFLREPIVWRASAVEYGVYEERRWSELPASYVYRALVTELGRTAGIRLTEDVRAAVLRVEVVAFEEVLAPVREATVALDVSLQDAQRRLLDRTFSTTAPITGDTPAATATSMGRALDEVVAQVASAVAAAVRAP